MRNYTEGDEEVIENVWTVELCTIVHGRVTLAKERLDIPSEKVYGLAMCEAADLSTGDRFTMNVVFDENEWEVLMPTSFILPPNLDTSIGYCPTSLTTVDRDKLFNNLAHLL